MKVKSKKTTKTFIKTASVLLFVTSFYTLQKYVTMNQGPYFINWNWTQTISCHYEKEGDALPPAEDLAPPEDSIFFHETSCRGGLNSRQACAVESAARKHPTRSVYVFFNSPVSEVVLTRSCLAKLTQFKNVILARLNTVKYSRGTALGEMLALRVNKQSLYRIEVTSDMLRFISLYKYGGMYLDTDVLVVKALDPLGTNWVAIQDEHGANVAVMSIGKEGIGHELIGGILDELKFDYRPSDWSHHGPGAMTRALYRLCNATHAFDFSARICRGFEVYDSPYVYPIHYTEADIYFKKGSPTEFSRFKNATEVAFVHHLWNKMTRDMTVEPGCPYDTLARQHCPTIWEMYGDEFGS